MKVSKGPKRGRSAKRTISRGKRRERLWFGAGIVVLVSLAIGIVGGTSLADFVIGGIDPFYTDRRLSAPRPTGAGTVNEPISDPQHSADSHSAPMRPDLLYGAATVRPGGTEEEGFPQATAAEAWVRPQPLPSFRNRARFGSGVGTFSGAETLAESDPVVADPSATPEIREP